MPNFLGALMMHHYETQQHTSIHHLHRLNSLFTGRGSHIYDATMVRLTRGLYRRVIADIAQLQPDVGKVLDAGTGPGTLARDIALRFPSLQVEGIDLSPDMIRLARQHAQQEHLTERVQFTIGDIAHLPYPDQSFGLVVSTISMHHWEDLEQSLRELHRVLQPDGHLWLYDFRFFPVRMVEQALARTPFASASLERRLVRTGILPFAVYQRLTIHKHVA
jgi:ubiquinone/menaquinone biosynthesis C-methylase UbiE